MEESIRSRYTRYYITIIDTKTRTIAGHIDNILPQGVFSDDESRGIAITPDGKKAYITYYYSRVIGIIDLSTNAVIGTITNFNDGSEDYYPYNIAFTPDGKKAYVTCNNGAFVLDAMSNTVIKYMPHVTRYYCLGIAISPDGKKVYLQDYYLTGVIIDTTDDVVIGNLPFKGYYANFIWAGGLVVSPDGNKAYVTNYMPDNLPQSVTVFDLTTNTFQKTIWGISWPCGIAFQPLPKPVSSFDVPTINLYPSVPLQFTSTSTDASDCTFTWDFGDGATLSGIETEIKTITHSYVNSGTYTVTLMLSNADNTFAQESKTIIVNPKLDVKFTADPTTAYATLTEVQFNDGSSNVPSGATYLWDFGDGSIDNTVGSTSHIYDIPGSYYVTLTIKDKDGIQFKSDTVNVVVMPYVTVASFTASKNGGQSGVSVTFDASGSQNAEKCQYLWNFGDGSSPYDNNYVEGGKTITHTYLYRDGFSNGKSNKVNTAHYTVTLKLIRHGIEVGKYTMQDSVNIVKK